MPMIECRHPSGFRVTFSVESDALTPFINWLLESGYTPDLPGDGWRRTPSGEPVCPRHGVPMRQRLKQSDSWFSHRVIDSQSGREAYCRGHATGLEGDGYEF